MSVFAAVMTGQSIAAISTIQVFGDTADAVIKKIFKPQGTNLLSLEMGKIILGTITDGSETIDQVIIGCEGQNNFAINCHGNPLIADLIMQLLAKYDVKIVTAEQLLTKILLAEEHKNTIEVEAKIAQVKAATIEGTKIIVNQIDAGLSQKAAQWLCNIETISLEQICTDANLMLKNSQTANLIIAGCTAAIVGPPNTGKSTLLNCLSGRQKSIVTGIKGTTRDWVAATCRIPPLSIELIDTAGLDETPALAPDESPERQAQQKTIEILAKVDLVLLMLDNSRPAEQFDSRFLRKIAGKKVLTVLNKSDLPAELDADKLPEILVNTVQISAKLSTGIENLLLKIPLVLGVTAFDLKQPICFTARQQNLLKQLLGTTSKDLAVSLITELLNGQLAV